MNTLVVNEVLGVTGEVGNSSSVVGEVVNDITGGVGNNSSVAGGVVL